MFYLVPIKLWRLKYRGNLMGGDWWAVLDRGFWWCFYCCYCWERGCSPEGLGGDWWAVLDRGFWWCFYCCYYWERGCSPDGRVGWWCVCWWSMCYSVVGLRVSFDIYKEFVHCWNHSSQQLLLPSLQHSQQHLLAASLHNKNVSRTGRISCLEHCCWWSDEYPLQNQVRFHQSVDGMVGEIPILSSPRIKVRGGFVRIMPLRPSFSSIFPIYCKTSCPRHDVKLHNYALTITTTTRGMCLWSTYPVLVIIRELEVLTSRPSVASWWP